MKRDTQQKARLAVQRHINESGEQGKDLARRCDVCRATLYRFLSGEDISMAAVEKLLAGVGFKDSLRNNLNILSSQPPEFLAEAIEKQLNYFVTIPKLDVVPLDPLDGDPVA